MAAPGNSENVVKLLLTILFPNKCRELSDPHYFPKCMTVLLLWSFVGGAGEIKPLRFKKGTKHKRNSQFK